MLPSKRGRQVWDVLVSPYVYDPVASKKVASKRLPLNSCLEMVASNKKRIKDIRVASKVSYCCFDDHTVPNLELTRTPPTVVLPTSQWWDGTTLKDIYTDEFLRIGRFS